MNKPRIMGYWAVQITPQQELIKFGRNGDTIRPYKSPNDTLLQCKWLKNINPKCRYYMLRVWSNGQMVTYDYE